MTQPVTENADEEQQGCFFCLAIYKHILGANVKSYLVGVPFKETLSPLILRVLPTGATEK